MKTGMIFGMLCALVAARGELSHDGMRAAADYAAGHRGTELLVDPARGKTIFDERQERGTGGDEDLLGHEGVFGTRRRWPRSRMGWLDLDERAECDAPGVGGRSAPSPRSRLRQLLNFSSGLEATFLAAWRRFSPTATAG